MTEYSVDEPDRADFKGEASISLIDGRPTYYFPSSKRRFRSAISGVVILIMILIVVGLVAVIYFIKLQGYVSQTVASVLNIIQIQIMSFLYPTVAYALNDYENHRTESDYRDAVVVKLFLFQFVNAYASFFYLAFVARWINECRGALCMQALATNLAILMGNDLITNRLVGYVVAVVSRMLALREAKLTEETVRTKPRVEREYRQLPYDSLKDGIQSYLEVATLFGHMCMFIVALPIASFVAAVYVFTHGRYKGWLILKYYQRPQPESSTGIGIWLNVFQALAVVAVSTNAALICFTMTLLDDWTVVG
eukprot:gene2692-3268_t